MAQPNLLKGNPDRSHRPPCSLDIQGPPVSLSTVTVFCSTAIAADVLADFHVTSFIIYWNKYCDSGQVGGRKPMSAQAQMYRATKQNKNHRDPNIKEPEAW